jgi:protein-L-isoaspartate O-methyltransferase
MGLVMSIKRRLWGAVLFGLAMPLAAQTTEPINAGPYVPTPTVIVSELLKLAEIKANDFVIDLGSGDGRLVITAAKQFGARGWGIDLQDHLVKLANDNAQQEGVGERVNFIQGDLFKANLKDATVVTLYLMPGTVVKLVPKFLAELRPGTRVVSHDYPLAPWQHERVEQFDFEEKVKISGTTRTVLYRYIIPAKIEGDWDVRLPPAISPQPGRFSFKRDPTLKVRGGAVIGGRSVALDDVFVRGEAFGARLQELRPGGERIVLRGVIAVETITGTAEVAGKQAPWSATLRR